MLKPSVKFLGGGAFAALLFAGILALGEQAPARVVAVGDVHGAYPEFVNLLERVGLIDGERHWVGGSAILVQTGDVPDRGPGTRQAMDLLMDLEGQAEKQKGQVIALLGNHEVMTITADLRYVTAEDYQAFSSERSEKVREDAYQDYKKFLSTHNAHRHSLPADDEAGHQKWMADHPPGFFERYDAFGPRGRYGVWLRGHDAVAQVGDTLFMHGGLNPKLHFRNLSDLNEKIRSDIAGFDSLWESLSSKKMIWRYMTINEAIRQAQEELAGMQSGFQSPDPDAVQKMQKLLSFQTWLINSQDSPLWYRGLALEPEEKLSKNLDKMLAHLKARYIVAAHTVRPKFSIMTRFENHVFLIDTGMLNSYFGGRGSALEIAHGGFRAIYSDGTQEVLVAPAGGAVPADPGQGNAKDKP